ncbi:hypothetical protein ACPF04_06445 [Campylobacter sp. MOP51]|uniref:hypothetical protein n=1 Tax=Campylobacter canis TaxID=3378588 RepID=UPI003C40350D
MQEENTEQTSPNQSKKEGITTNQIIKYAIIESYPSIIKDPIPIKAFILLILYICYIIKYMFMFCKKRGVSTIKNLFRKQPDYEIIDGSTDLTSFYLQIMIQLDELNNHKRDVKTTHVKTLYGLDAKKQLRVLLHGGLIELKDVVNLGHFVLRKEIIEFKSPITLTSNVFVTKEFNVPSMQVWSLRQKYAIIKPDIEESTK